MLSPRYTEAVAYATDAHAGQVRKGTDIPYITHPIAVSSLVIESDMPGRNGTIARSRTSSRHAWASLLPSSASFGHR
jgi:hypothetical protein